MIVMNDISRSDIGFDSSLNEIVLVTSKGESTGIPALQAGLRLGHLDTFGNQSAAAAVEQRTTV